MTSNPQHAPPRGPDEARGDHRRRFADQLGIALQTVIIMVVLLAIAGGVAAVLLNRGSAASDQLQNQEVTVKPEAYKNSALCVAAGYKWTTGSGCGA